MSDKTTPMLVIEQRCNRVQAVFAAAKIDGADVASSDGRTFFVRTRYDLATRLTVLSAECNESLGDRVSILLVGPVPGLEGGV